MSQFAVTREKIGAVRPIAKADRIELATLAGMDFQFVTRKGQFQPGQDVLYIPIDAVLPAPLIETLGLTGRLSGSEQNRVHTITLRGVYSQGIVTDTSLVPADVTDITGYLGITKYEAAPNVTKDGVLMPRPDNQSAYDLESSDRFMDIADSMMDEIVEITEKLEGQNVWVTAYPPTNTDPTRHLIGKKDNTIHKIDGVENHVHNVMSKENWVDVARRICEDTGQIVSIYSEFIGPGCEAGNYYELTEAMAPAFEIRIGYSILNPEEANATLAAYGVQVKQRAPVIATGITLREWLNGRTIKEAADGPSLLVPGKRREGIVIRLYKGRKDDRIGYVILKQRGPLYLANTGL